VVVANASGPLTLNDKPTPHSHSQSHAHAHAHSCPPPMSLSIQLACFPIFSTVHCIRDSGYGREQQQRKIQARLSRNLVIVREIAYKRCLYSIPFPSLTALNLTWHVDALATAHYHLPPLLPLLLPHFGFGGSKTAASRFLIVRTLA